MSGRKSKVIPVPAPPQRALPDPESVPLDPFKSAMIGEEPRILFDYWNGLRGDRLFPDRSDFDVVDLPRSLIAFLYILTTDEDGMFRFRLAGTRMTEAFRTDISGRRLDEVVEGYDLQKAVNSYSRVMRTGVPWFSRVTYRVDDDIADIQYQRLTLPLGEAGRVSRLLGAIFIHKEDRIYEFFHEIYMRRGLKQVDRQDLVLASGGSAM